MTLAASREPETQATLYHYRETNGESTMPKEEAPGDLTRRFPKTIFTAESAQ